MAVYEAMMRRHDVLDQVVVIVDDPKLTSKGDKYGECYRGVCRSQGAQWFNDSTRKYYCQDCARLIMRWPENANLLHWEK